MLINSNIRLTKIEISCKIYMNKDDRVSRQKNNSQSQSRHLSVIELPIVWKYFFPSKNFQFLRSYAFFLMLENSIFKKALMIHVDIGRRQFLG
jgi:hypothetical protein